jgi:hypothetical protein
MYFSIDNPYIYILKICVNVVANNVIPSNIVLSVIHIYIMKEMSKHHFKHIVQLTIGN